MHRVTDIDPLALKLRDDRPIDTRGCTDGYDKSQGVTFKPASTEPDDNEVRSGPLARFALLEQTAK